MITFPLTDILLIWIGVILSIGWYENSCYVARVKILYGKYKNKLMNKIKGRA